MVQTMSSGNDRMRLRLELLYHVSREVAAALDLRTVLQRVLLAAIRNVGGERASIIVLDDAQKPLEATIVYGQQFHEHTTQQLRETVERGLAGWVIQHRQAALLSDTSRDERWLKRPDDQGKTGAKSALCVPLLVRDRLVGVLTLVHPMPNAFTQEHLELMQAIADQAGVAVLNARLYSESRRQAQVMTALVESAMVINTSLHMDKVLQRILQQAMQALQVEMAAIGLLDLQTNEVAFRAATGQHADRLLHSRLPADTGVVGNVLRERRGEIIAGPEGEKHLRQMDCLKDLQAQAVAIAPLPGQDGPIGVIQAVRFSSASFEPDALSVLIGLGNLAGIAIQNAQFYERMEAAQRRYQELFQDSIDPILITDWQGNILEINRQAEWLIGLNQDELRLHTIDSLHPVDWDCIGRQFEMLRNNQACRYESSLRRRDGTQRHIEVYVRRVDFGPSGVLQWILRDITARKELDILREDLISMIYHDLRSPLSNIVSSLEMLRILLDTSDDQVRTILTIASSSAARLERLVVSLLDLNRLEVGQSVVDQKVIDLKSLIEQAVHDVGPAVENRRHRLVTVLPEDLPPVWVDPSMILRVIINLLENAVKFTPSGGYIEVGARPNGESVECWVRDSGPGIPPSDRERVFDKFSRLRQKDKPAGLGIGLAFCRLAVQAHGGHIWIEDPPGGGASFHFTLPCATQEQRKG